MNRLNLLFPVETINRELDFRLFLAVMCATPRNQIFIGQHDAVFGLSRFTEGGVYVGKHIFRDRFPIETGARYREIKGRGYSLVHLDEEGAIYYGGPREWEAALNARVDTSLMDEEDYVCTWGDFQLQHFKRKKPKNLENIRNTGHPRFDLFKPLYRSFFQGELRKLAGYGRFVLINTKLAPVNPGLGREDAFAHYRGYDRSNPTVRIGFIEAYAHYTKILVNFVSLINRMSIDFPDFNFVIRPHPSEDLQYYRTIFQGIGNVHVVHRGSIPAWLFACEVMVHDGCTTGVEAHLAGNNIINFKSLENERYDSLLPNAFGTKCANQEEVFAALRRLRDGEKLPTSIPTDTARSLISNLDQPSFPRLLSVIDESQERTLTRQRGRLGFRRNEFKLYALGQRAEKIGRAAVRALFPKKMRRHRAYSSMFYGLNRDDLDTKLTEVSRIVKRRVEWELLSPDLLTVWQA